MRNFLVGFVFAISFLWVPKGSAADFRVHRVNGYEVILIDMAKGNATHVEMFVPNGSYHDPAEYAGIAHLLEHLLFNGSQNYPGVTAMRLLQDLGADTNAHTGEAYTRYFST